MTGETRQRDVDPQDAQSETTGGGCCCGSLTHDLTAHGIEADAGVFSALANDTRYEILRYLAASDAEVCACELVPELDVNQSTTSRALNVLHRAGLVTRRKDGRWRHYTTTNRAETLLAAIDTTREEGE